MAYTNNSDRYSAAMPPRVRDVLGRLKVTLHQNVYEADFEYGTQPLRWEAVTQGGGSITQVPNSGGVRMRIGTSAGDTTIRQSRPYHRYQPGKTMFMATGCNFGTALTGNVQRVGFFDDANGVFFEQSVVTPDNPFGIYAVVRTDVGGKVTETRYGIDQWNGDRATLSTIDFTRIQMFWIEYGWYGAGATRWGFWLNGEPIIGHQIGWGNFNNPQTGGQQGPWARTGNLPVRYEQRNTQGTTSSNDMYHWGVSVIVEGGRDEQRGFTYSYGMAPLLPTRSIAANTTRYPVMSIRSRALGTLEYGNILTSASGTVGGSTAASTTSTSAFTGYISGTTLTVSTVTSGTVAINQTLIGTGLLQGTYIVANISGSGAGSTWTVSNSQTTASVASPTTISGACNIITVASGLNTPNTAFGGTATNQYQGRYIYFAGVGTSGTSAVGKIITHTDSQIYFCDPVFYTTVSGTWTVSDQGSFTGSVAVTGGQILTAGSTTNVAIGQSISGTGIATGTYITSINGSLLGLSRPMTANATGTYITRQGWCIGLPNRGQLLPKRLMAVQTTASVNCTVEIIAGNPVTPVTLTGSAFTALTDLGSTYSFAERDVSATALTGGEVVFAFVLAAGAGVQDIDFTYFFALYNNVKGSQLDTLTVAVSVPTPSSPATVGAHLICQEAMS
jgi:hypothetical protein